MGRTKASLQNMEVMWSFLIHLSSTCIQKQINLKFDVVQHDSRKMQHELFKNVN